MYDTILVPCPGCGTEVGFQSKSGVCLLNEYKLDLAPADALADVNRHSPQHCPECGTAFHVKLRTTGVPVYWRGE